MVFVSISRSDGDGKWDCHLQHQHFRPSQVPHYSETKGQFSDFKFLVILSKEQKVTLAQFNVPLLV